VLEQQELQTRDDCAVCRNGASCKPPSVTAPGERPDPENLLPAPLRSRKQDPCVPADATRPAGEARASRSVSHARSASAATQRPRQRWQPVDQFQSGPTPGHEPIRAARAWAARPGQAATHCGPLKGVQRLPGVDWACVICPRSQAPARVASRCSGRLSPKQLLARLFCGGRSGNRTRPANAESRLMDAALGGPAAIGIKALLPWLKTTSPPSRTKGLPGRRVPAEHAHWNRPSRREAAGSVGRSRPRWSRAPAAIRWQ